MKKKRHSSNQHTPTHHVRAKKFLGQHFLKDEHIAQKIAATLQRSKNTNVLEIGPGTGVLTKHLLQNPIRLKVMEIDRDSVFFLQHHFKSENIAISDTDFDIIEADFLTYDLDGLFENQEFAIIGNFPYNISSQILFKTIENRDRIPFFSGMFQKEVAKRICEPPGTKSYGILSVLTQAFYTAEYLFSVPPGVFSPPPKVDSGVLKLTRKEDYTLNCDEKLFFKVVKTGFQQRRKTLRNSLKSFHLSETAKKEAVFNKRPEQLSVTDFVELTNLIATM